MTPPPSHSSVNISILKPPPIDIKLKPISITIKLNNEIISQFKNCLNRNLKPKLIVKDGNFSIKITDDLIYPCTQIPENLNVDIYSNCRFDGRISTKLNVITGSRQIKEHKVSPVKKGPVRKPTPVSLTKLVSPTPSSPLNFSPYLVSINGSKSDMLLKVLSFMALGPTTKENLVKFTGIPLKDLDSLISTYTQAYNPKDNFIVDDVFPNLNSLPSDLSNHLILKDKSYKDLKPWDWQYYSDNERTLIINNIHNALTRLGFSETHPLRKKICEEPINKDDQPVKKSSLGGGLLISKKQPFKRSQTESPKLTESKLAGVPLKTSTSNKNASKRKLSSSSSSDDDEEKHSKKNKYDSYISPSSINEEDISSSESINEDNDSAKNNNINGNNNKRLEYYTNLALKFKMKYKEYETLYKLLKTNPKRSDKKNLIKLFEWHNILSEWKKKLWDFDNENKSKLNIMNLSKHKKTSNPMASTSSTSTPLNISTTTTPSGSNIKLSSQSPVVQSNRFNRSNNTHNSNNQNNNSQPRVTKPKISLDY